MQRPLQAALATGGITLLALLSGCAGKATTQAAVPVSSAASAPNLEGLPPATGRSPSRSPARAPGVAPATFASTYARVQSGVLRLDSSSCTGGRSGGGFLISPTLVVTAAQLVDDRGTVRVTQSIRSTSATVIGFDETLDLALLRTSQPFVGHYFALDPAGPHLGQRVGVVGLPTGEAGPDLHDLGGRPHQEGRVSGLHRAAKVAGHLRASLIELESSLPVGNHGTPLIAVTGQVVGLISGGATSDDTRVNRYAVDTTLARPRLQAWQAHPAPVPPTRCTDIRGPDRQVVEAYDLPGGEGGAITETMNLYFRSLHQGDYATAYAQLHPSAQLGTGLGKFTRGLGDSYDTDIRYRDFRHAGPDLVVWATFQSTRQAGRGPDGLTCLKQSIDYTLRHSDGLWLILGSAPHAGSAQRYQPCTDAPRP